MEMDTLISKTMTLILTTQRNGQTLMVMVLGTTLIYSLTTLANGSILTETESVTTLTNSNMMEANGKILMVTGMVIINTEIQETNVQQSGVILLRTD